MKNRKRSWTRCSKTDMTKLIHLAILGMPNVGKSTLLNRLVGEKIAAVSPKAQTTRTRITGVLTKGERQYVFLDTPGLLKPQNRLGEQMAKQIRSTLSDVDCALFVTESVGKLRRPEEALLARIREQEIPVIALINKCDAVNKAGILPMIDALAQAYPFAAIIPVSAKTGEGIDELFDELEPLMEESPFSFEADALTDQSERTLASEMIREKLLWALSDEVPHGIAVVIENFSSERGHLLHIGAVIYCEKASHKGIVIGKGGALLKEVGIRAREDLEAFFGEKVDLSLWVRVKENWRDRPSLIADFGLKRDDDE